MKTIAVILVFLILATLVNLKVAQRRSRDAQRKSDVRAVFDALARYQDEFGFLPASEDGKILACNGPCQWGKDALADIEDPAYPPYLEKLPQDPHAASAVSYYYLATEKHFQVLASLEGMDEAEFDPKILSRNLPCGSRICNFGLSSGSAPLDKSPQEYENELEEL